MILIAFNSIAFCEYFIVGYYPAWQRWSFPADKIAYPNLTHIAHAFIWPEANGTISTFDYFLYPELITKTHQADKKILVSIGGWGQSDGFSPMVANSTARAKFVTNIKNFCVNHGYDGVDIDWEYPQTTADRINLTLFIKELRNALNEVNPTMLLTMAVPAGDWFGDRYDFDNLKNLLNWISCMTYDFHGPWTDHAGHNAPLYAPASDPEGSADLSIQYLLSIKIPSDKILLGLPFYGREFAAMELYGSSTVSDALLYNEIIPKMSTGWLYHWDDLAKVPYLTNSFHTKLNSFDDTVSIRIKCEYTKNKKLGGVKIWALGQDDLGSNQPLLKTIKNILQANDISTYDLTEHQILHSFSFIRNYPNPFNNNASIRYYIIEPTRVTLEVYDTLGEKISILLNKVQKVGWHTVIFDTNNIPSGLYFYKLSTSSFSKTEKMILMR